MILNPSMINLKAPLARIECSSGKPVEVYTVMKGYDSVHDTCIALSAHGRIYDHDNVGMFNRVDVDRWSRVPDFGMAKHTLLLSSRLDGLRLVLPEKN
jgi:hypothetical protein